MIFNKCLLIRPSFGDGRHVIASIPVGLGYIAEALVREKIDYEIFDMAFKDQGLKGYEVSDLKEKVAEFKPDIIGFSLMTLKYKEHYSLIEYHILATKINGLILLLLNYFFLIFAINLHRLMDKYKKTFLST